MFGGRKKKKTGHNPFFNTKSLGSNRITIEPQAHPLKNMFLFKTILIQSRAHYVFFTRFSSKLFRYLVHLGNVGKYHKDYIFWLFLSSIFFFFKISISCSSNHFGVLSKPNWFRWVYEQCWDLFLGYWFFFIIPEGDCCSRGQSSKHMSPQHMLWHSKTDLGDQIATAFFILFNLIKISCTLGGCRYMKKNNTL